MQAQAQIFLNRARELENRAAKHKDGTLKITLLKLAAYYRQLSEQSTNMNESESPLPEALSDFV